MLENKAELPTADYKTKAYSNKAGFFATKTSIY
jgi:hypothetical protein